MFGHDARVPRTASCELRPSVLRCCTPLSDENRAEPSQHRTCQDTQYPPDCRDVRRKRRDYNNYGQNELDRCGGVITPARVWRFGHSQRMTWLQLSGAGASGLEEGWA